MTDLIEALVSEPFGAEALKKICREPGFFEQNKLYRRRDIADKVRCRFAELGGDTRLTNDEVARVFKACMGGRQGIPFLSVARGRYRFTGYDEESGPVEVDAPTDQVSRDLDFIAEHEFGEGQYEVYSWCLPRYALGDSLYPVKIGRAGAEGFTRRFSDFAAHVPERPRLLVRIRCQQISGARELEMLLHAYFKHRGRKIDTLPGNEWFRTNRDEIREAIEVLCPRLSDRDPQLSGKEN